MEWYIILFYKNKKQIFTFKGKPYSKKYYEILEVKKKLPAWEAKE